MKEGYEMLESRLSVVEEKMDQMEQQFELISNALELVIEQMGNTREILDNLPTRSPGSPFLGFP